MRLFLCLSQRSTRGSPRRRHFPELRFRKPWQLPTMSPRTAPSFCTRRYAQSVEDCRPRPERSQPRPKSRGRPFQNSLRKPVLVIEIVIGQHVFRQTPSTYAFLYFLNFGPYSLEFAPFVLGGPSIARFTLSLLTIEAFAQRFANHLGLRFAC